MIFWRKIAYPENYFSVDKKILIEIQKIRIPKNFFFNQRIHKIIGKIFTFAVKFSRWFEKLLPFLSFIFERKQFFWFWYFFLWDSYFYQCWVVCSKKTQRNLKQIEEIWSILFLIYPVEFISMRQGRWRIVTYYMSCIWWSYHHFTKISDHVGKFSLSKSSTRLIWAPELQGYKLNLLK